MTEPTPTPAQARALQLIADQRVYLFRAPKSDFTYWKCENGRNPAYATMRVLKQHGWYELDVEWEVRDGARIRYACLTEAGRKAHELHAG